MIETNKLEVKMAVGWGKEITVSLARVMKASVTLQQDGFKLVCVAFNCFCSSSKNHKDTVKLHGIIQKFCI